MIPAAVILLGLALVWIAGFLVTNRREKTVSAALSACSKCGGATTVRPDPSNSRLLVHCQASACGNISVHRVRASALSLFGLSSLLLAILAGTVGYSAASFVTNRPAGRVAAAAVAVLLGACVARFCLRVAAFGLLNTRLPIAWQEEIVAYLAPPPWRADAPEPLESANDPTD